jgi:rhodanese-related sulfurtransferase
MRIKNVLLAGIATVSLGFTGALAQTPQHDHGHDSAKAGAKADAAKQQMTAKELKARLDKGEKVIIIDARHDLAGQIIKGAIHVPIEKLDDWAKNADKGSVITCPHDEAADAEVVKLAQMGFKKAYALAGGMDAARAAGIEVVTPSNN